MKQRSLRSITLVVIATAILTLNHTQTNCGWLSATKTVEKSSFLKNSTKFISDAFKTDYGKISAVIIGGYIIIGCIAVSGAMIKERNYNQEYQKRHRISNIQQQAKTLYAKLKQAATGRELSEKEKFLAGKIEEALIGNATTSTISEHDLEELKRIITMANDSEFLDSPWYGKFLPYDYKAKEIN